MNYLEHHGIKGQQWGVRRYQNEDGTLTQEGRKRYGISNEQLITGERYRNAINEAKQNGNASLQISKIKQTYSQDKHAAKKVWHQERKDFKSTKSTGRHIVNFLFNGPFGAYTYNSLRASGNSRLKSEGLTIVSTILGGPIGNVIASTLVGKDKIGTYANN